MMEILIFKDRKVH